jgi:hypothetical protein
MFSTMGNGCLHIVWGPHPHTFRALLPIVTIRTGHAQCIIQGRDLSLSLTHSFIHTHSLTGDFGNEGMFHSFSNSSINCTIGSSDNTVSNDWMIANNNLECMSKETDVA